jgi:hypothetical protein
MSVYEDCDCPFDIDYTCPQCGHRRITNHCPHDRVQNPCPACGHQPEGSHTPMEAISGLAGLFAILDPYNKLG